MPKKIRLGYDILAKRAIETESGVNIDDALRNIRSYELVSGTSENIPDVPVASRSSKILYLVRVVEDNKEKFFEWIWYVPETGSPAWKCVGAGIDADDSWKRWSEANGSSSTGETSVYIGLDNVIERDDGFAFGERNSIKITDNKEYAGSDAVCIGRDNVSLNSIDGYNFGHDNVITGGNSANIENKLAMNLGAGNTITSEGVNIGKANISDTFGISIGQSNTSHNSAITIGDANVADGSFTIGNANVVYGTSIVAGMRNVTPVSSGAHATLIGYDNISNSTRASVTFTATPQTNELAGSIDTNSILMGVRNISNHYNSILCGIGNISSEPIYDGINDDGLMVAIGRENKVERNYDIAVGFKSEAMGGENIALQHSKAYGCGNFSMLDSTIKYGIHNIALVESSLIANGHVDDDTGITLNNSVTHNYLFNSAMSPGAATCNLIFNTDMANVQVSDGLHRNIIMIGTRPNHQLTINATSFVDNIVFGAKNSYDYSFKGSSPITMTSAWTADRNILIGNAYKSLNISSNNEFQAGFNDNIVYSATMNVISSKGQCSNIVIGSTLNMDAPNSGFHNNIILGRSVVNEYNSTSNWNFTNNFLVSSQLRKDADDPNLYLLPTRGTVSSNVLFGSLVCDSSSCVSFGEECEEYWTTNSNAPVISYSSRVFNFGDNRITDSETSLVMGLQNTVTRIANSFIYGRSNTVIGGAIDIENYTRLTRQTIFGNGNTIRVDTTNVTDTEHVCGGFLVGYNNTIKLGKYCFDNKIFGNNNSIQRSASSSDYAVSQSRNVIVGDHNGIYSNVVGYSVIGTENTVSNSTISASSNAYCISNGFVQGNNNSVSDGSNIISMGNGIVSTGHNSVAIGSQLISNQWQTVIGKYNEAISGPSRVISKFSELSTYSVGDVVWYEGAYYKCKTAVTTAGAWVSTNWEVTTPESDKAIFLIGNGYSETDGSDWQTESKIHRSNAMVVYADGTVKANDFVTDNDLMIAAGNGISVTEDIINSSLIISLNSELQSVLVNHPGADGKRYTLECNNGLLRWVEIGTTTV